MANIHPAHPGTAHVPPVHQSDHKKRFNLFRSYHGKEGEGIISGKMGKREMLHAIESSYLLHKGNKEHRKRLDDFYNDGGKLPKKIKTLLLICTDARMGGMFSFEDFAKQGILPVYVAGNVSDILGNRGIKETLRRMDNDSSVIIMGHAKCGAVHCASEPHKFKKLRNIAKFLGIVKGSSELDNLEEQVSGLKKDKYFAVVRERKNIRLVSAYADIDESVPSISCKDDSEANEADAALLERLSSHFIKTNKDQDLSQKQFAHTIVISGPSLPFDPREIFSCAANQLFCVSGGDFGGKRHKGALTNGMLATAEMAALNLLDIESLASIEYSVTANSSAHIVLLHSDIATINAWETELMKKSDIICNAVVEGRLEITATVYDSQTGMATPVRHLVNEEMAKDS